ncbi:MAG: lysylphosphatidylglycerol synthase domain-containing protein [Gemmatimonadaceae bacterium]
MHSPATDQPRSSLRLALPALLSLVLVAVAVGWFADRWAAVAATGERPAVAWPWLALAAVLLVAHAFTALAIWHRAMRAIGAVFPWRTSLDLFAPSLLARYVPGKIWANALRLALSRRAGVRLGATTGAIVWETIIGLGTAGVVALAALSGGPDSRPRNAAALLLAITATIWIVARLAVRHPRGAALLARFGSAELLRAPSALARAVPYALVGWFAYGLAHLAIARAVAPVTGADLPLVMGAVALAWAGGYLAFVMPVGLGVRDGLLLVLLAPLLEPAAALLFVALGRLVQLAVDAALTGVWLISAAARRRYSSAPSPPAKPTAPSA